MSVKTGTRPGSKPTDKYPGWDYVQSQGPGWEAMREVNREVMRWEGGVNTAIAQVDKALTALHVALVMEHGGHVDKGALAKSGLKLSMEPAQVIAHIMGLLPDNIPALKTDK